MLRHLAARGHDVTLCSLTRSAEEAQSVAAVEALGIRVVAEPVRERIQSLKMLAALVTSQPCTFAYFRSRSLARRIEALLQGEPWDLILVHCSSMGRYVAHSSAAPKVMDFTDMDSRKWLDYAASRRGPIAWFYALEGRKVEREEVRLARAFDFCTTISRAELASLEQLAPGAEADWFPNGVDLDYFAPSAEPYDPDLVVFVGRMDYYPNEQAMQWFTSEVLPLLRSRRPQLKLKIVGADPPPNVRRLARLEGVEVTGYVPDVRPHVRRAAVSVAPLMIARGLQNKVLESMAMGVPVVAAARVVDGLAANAEWPIVTADTATEYLRAVSSLLDQPAERARLARASRAAVEGHFSWPRAMARLDTIMRNLSARSAQAVAQTAPAPDPMA
jgi:sugar transferase (PEP-CTERM/EpsH1 system associated)